ncbi:hypothetical protein A3N69_10255 [Klebsiella aerogenes]|nr:hypothetical protein A3N56_17430 [Klebsiella aerogenes]KZR56310.1 hypothetical protein A3N69_10255 [Klebsiella aerogenes]
MQSHFSTQGMAVAPHHLASQSALSVQKLFHFEKKVSMLRFSFSFLIVACIVKGVSGIVQ